MSASVSTNEVQGLEYVVLGVATCYQRDDEGRLQEMQVAEPVPAAELDCLFRGVRSTSYQLLYATTYAEIVQNDAPVLPSDIVPDGVVAAQDFVARVQAATRSYRVKPEFKHVPLNETVTTESGAFTLKHNPEPKRILDVNYEPSEADNVKQHAYTHAKL
jgi:hypothetical protein